MFKQKILVGKLSDFSIIRYLLELREIAKLHKIGDSFIEISYWGVRYDALAFNHLLNDLEGIAKTNQLIIKAINSESSFEEVLGLNDSTDIEASLSFASWAILCDVDRRMNNDGSGGIQTVKEI
jgi:hypothetical protein